MKKFFYMVIVAMVTPLLSGCPSSKGSSAPPPSNFSAISGEGRVTVTWTPTPGVDYWIFSATDPSLTALNWSGLAHANAQVNAATPLYMCGLLDGLPYYFASNGRTNGGPGGTSSPTITATPYNASTNWTLNPTPIADIVNNAVVNPDISGLAYASLTTCGNNAAISATGMFAAVGSGGAIFTSNDGISWGPVVSPASSNLNAVTGYAANQNNALNPALRWMAVGDAGTVVYFDGSVWVLANTHYPNSTLAAANPGNSTLRSITQVGGTFYAVGDAGTIISSADAINWTMHNSPPVTANNLNGVTYGGGIFVAVGNNGTLLTSGDGNTWAVPTPISPNTLPITPAIPSGINLKSVVSFASIYGDIYVAVGDGGTIVTRTTNNFNNNLNWTAQTLPGAPNLVGITVEARAVETNGNWGTIPAADPKLGFISSAQFMAIDSNGNAYTSINGYDWSTAIPTGATGVSALTSSGFGYVVTGNSGVSATAF